MKRSLFSLREENMLLLGFPMPALQHTSSHEEDPAVSVLCAIISHLWGSAHEINQSGPREQPSCVGSEFVKAPAAMLDSYSCT